MQHKVSKIKAGHALGFLICGCSLFYKRELWAGAHSTKSLKICGCKKWCPKDLRVHAPAAPALTHSLLGNMQMNRTYVDNLFGLKPCICCASLCSTTVVILLMLLNLIVLSHIYCRNRSTVQTRSAFFKGYRYVVFVCVGKCQ